MARNIARIAAGIAVTLGTLLGLATAVLAKDDKVIIKLPPKSCTWVQSGTVVPSGGYTRDNKDGTLWKCSNGRWSQAPTKGGRSRAIGRRRARRPHRRDLRAGVGVMLVSIGHG